MTEYSFAQQKEYILLDKTSSADIDRSFILRLDKAPRGLPMLDSLFKPVKGAYTVYRFLATFRGKSYTGQEKEFHDLLLVKTDDNSKVIKAYHYTLEWAEMPLEQDMYISTSKDLFLKNGLTIDAFSFERPWYDDADKKLKDNGVVRWEP
jgi:hypothetical protein